MVVAADFLLVLPTLLPLGDVDVSQRRQALLLPAVVQALDVVADVALGGVEALRFVACRVGQSGPYVLRAEIGVDGADAFLAAVAIVQIALGGAILFALDVRRQLCEFRVYLHLHLAACDDALGGVCIPALPVQEIFQSLISQGLQLVRDGCLVIVWPVRPAAGAHFPAASFRSLVRVDYKAAIDAPGRAVVYYTYKVCCSPVTSPLSVRATQAGAPLHSFPFFPPQIRGFFDACICPAALFGGPLTGVGVGRLAFRPSVALAHRAAAGEAVAVTGHHSGHPHV